MTNYWNITGNYIMSNLRDFGPVSHLMSENGNEKQSGKKTARDRERREALDAHGEGLDANVQRQIGKRLQKLYDGVLDEPIPDRFVELLKQLEDSSKQKKS